MLMRALHADAPDAAAQAVQEARKAACSAEFQLTQECLQINPKSYCVWFHRQWCAPQSAQPRRRKKKLPLLRS